MATCSCPKCGREYAQPLATLAERLRHGKTQCLMCGAEMVFSEEVHAALEDGGAVDLAALRSYTCASCGCTWATSPDELTRRRRTGCRVCGAPLRAETLAALDALAAVPAVPTREATLHCLVCQRATKVRAHAPDDLHPCRFCGAELRLPSADGQPARPPPLAEPAATPEDVVRAFRDLGRGSALLELVREMLLARAGRQEVGAAEAAHAARCLAWIDAWRPEPGVPFWPLTVEDAEDALPPILYPGKPYDVERGDAGSEIVFVVSQADPQVSAETQVVNVFGLIGLMTVGWGVRRSEKAPAVGDQRRARIAFRPRAEGGVTLALSTQFNDEPPRPAPRAVGEAFGAFVSGQKEALVAYWGTRALFGSWAGGSAAAAATVPALAQRLAALGLERHAVRWAPRLCLTRAGASTPTGPR